MARATWVRRLSFAAVLVVAAVAPGPASGSSSLLCRGAHCDIAGTVRWARSLPGVWAARSGLAGTTPAHGQAYAALGSRVAAIGFGMTVYAYGAVSGQPLWTAALTGFPAGSMITSVRVWPGVVSAGVVLPAPPVQASGGASPGQQRPARQGPSTRRQQPSRREVVLDAGTGQRIRAFPAARFGGAVAAGPATTVIVRTHAVTCYSNRNGHVVWSRPTGQAPQAWREDGSHLYVTVAAGGYLGTAPVTAVRRINLQTGAQQLVRPQGRAFHGTLSLAYDGVVLFTSARGVTAYSGSTGSVLWSRAGALPEGVDVVAQRIYLLIGNVLAGVAPHSGATLARMSGAAAAASSGLYTVRAGAVLGLDHGAHGQAWGYNVASQRVVWTSGPLPWPHYFVGLSGIGGSASPRQDEVLLAVCAQAGPPVAGDAGQSCRRPELVALDR